MVFLRFYLWIAPHVLLALLLVLLWPRGRQKQLPVFATYLVIEGLSSLVALTVAFLHLPQVTYAWVIFIGNGVSNLLEVAVIYQLADRLVFYRFRSVPILRNIFAATLAALVLLAAAVSGTFSEVSMYTPRNLSHAIDFSTSLVKVGMLLLLFMLTRTLQIAWRNWATGVALGFGVSACINLASSVLRNYFGNPSLVAVDVLEMSGFHICVVIWLVYVLLPERSSVLNGEGFPKTDIELWNHQLERVAGQ